MTWTLIIVLIIIGFLFLLLEILVIPGTTFVGAIGMVSMATGIWQAYIVYGSTAGHLTLLSSVVLGLIGVYYALKGGTWKKAMLDANIDSKVNLVDQTELAPGTRGKSISRLAPMGKASFNGKFYEVQSVSGFVDENTEIEIIKIENNKIIIKTLTNT